MIRLVLLFLLLAAPALAQSPSPPPRVITPLSDITVTTAATAIKGLTNNRYALSCTNNHGSIAVRWGSAAVTAATGQRITAGSSIEILNIAAVYMVAESGSVTISCTEELK